MFSMKPGGIETMTTMFNHIVELQSAVGALESTVSTLSYELGHAASSSKYLKESYFESLRTNHKMQEELNALYDHLGIEPKTNSGIIFVKKGSK